MEDRKYKEIQEDDEWVWSKDTFRSIFSGLIERKKDWAQSYEKTAFNDGVDFGLFWPST